MKILNIKGLAALMGVSRQTIHSLLREKRIKADFTDNDGGRYWKQSTAEDLAKQHEGQKALPPRTLRKYE